MRRFPWLDADDPQASGSGRASRDAAAIHPLAEVLRCLEQVTDPQHDEASDERAWRSTRFDRSVVDDFAAFLAPPPADEPPPHPDPDFKERLRRRLWRLHVALHVRPVRRH